MLLNNSNNPASPDPAAKSTGSNDAGANDFELCFAIVFIFPEDNSRQGDQSSYALALDADGILYKSHNKLTGDLRSIAYNVVDFTTCAWDPTSYPYMRLLGGKAQSDWKNGDPCDAGDGNKGLCIGRQDVRIRSQAWARAAYEAWRKQSAK